MSATVSETKTLTKLDLSIRTLKPRSTAESEASEKQNARIVVVTSY